MEKSSLRLVYFQSHNQRVIGTIPAGVSDDVVDEGGISESSNVRFQTRGPHEPHPRQAEMLRFLLTVVIHKFNGRPRALHSATDVVTGLDNSLKILGTDYVDIFYLHTVLPDAYDHAVNEILPALLREKDKGKFRFLGITEMPPKDARHEMLQRALKDDYWDVVMFAFHMLNQNARQQVFPETLSRNVGTMIMFAVRSLFSTPGRLQQDLKVLATEGKVPAGLAEKSQPLDFLLHDGGARSVIEAAYRYARHEPGADVVLFGTSNSAHVESNIKAILAPPLPPADVQKLEELFGNLVGVGLDEPNLKT